MKIEYNEYLVGYAIKKIRERKGISKMELSTMSFCSRKTIQGFENHQKLPTMNTFFKICRALNVSPHEVFMECMK